jgi:opacity protein-like surface antigen
LNGLKYILVLAIYFVSYPVLADLPVYGTTSETRQAQQYQPPDGKALVYIYQPVTGGQSISPVILINNYKVGRLVPGSFMVWKLSAGRLNIRFDGTDSPGQTLNMRAGNIYRFRLTIPEESAGPNGQVKLVPASLHSELMAMRLLKNPKTVTSISAVKPIQKKEETPVVANAQKSEPERQKSKVEKKTEYIPTYDAGIEPGGFELTLKTGTLTLSNGMQTILAVDRDFDDNASGIFAAEFDYQFENGLSVGGEFIKYSANFTTVGLSDTHTVDVSVVLVNAKQYFRTRSGLQPYLSAGAGYAVTNVSGPTISGNTAGVAYQVSTGLQYRGSNVGVFGELKYIGARTEDDNGETIDVTGAGLFAGIAFHF